MATLTWIGGTIPLDWTDTNDWEAGTITPAGPPGTGDTALVGQLSLETSLYDMTVDFEKPSDASTIDATNVDLGANLQFFVTNPFGNAGLNVYRVIGTGTLDATNPNHDVSPHAGAIDLSAGPLMIDLAAGATFFDRGSIGGVGLAIAADSTGNFENDSTIDITGSFQLRSGTALTGAGVVDLQGNQAVADIAGSVVSGQTFAFTGQTNPGVLDGALTIEDPATFQGSVVLAEENEIALVGVNSGESSYGGGILTLDNGYTLHVALGPGAASLLVQPTGGETLIFAEAACFAAGTRIATPDGETPVEHLRPGDRVRLARGGSAAVVWCGHRQVRCDRHPRPHDVWPIRVRAGAFAAGRPARDLLLSPDHAVFVRGVLVPVRYLANGATIVQEPVAAITYHHVELARHDVLLAEGLPAESYLDTGNRAAFANAGAATLHPTFDGTAAALDTWAREACAPLALHGPPVEAARRRLLRRAATLGARRTDDPDLRILADDARVDANVTDGFWHVRLPAGTRTVRLRSRTWVPAQMRPAETDARRLGVAVDRLWLDRREASLDSPGLAAGWHALEAALRWTDGDATLAISGVCDLSFRVALTGSYWRPSAPALTQAA